MHISMSCDTLYENGRRPFYIFCSLKNSFNNKIFQFFLKIYSSSINFGGEYLIPSSTSFEIPCTSRIQKICTVLSMLQLISNEPNLYISYFFRAAFSAFRRIRSISLRSLRSRSAWALNSFSLRFKCALASP